MICRKCRHLNPPDRLVCLLCKSLVTTISLKVITGPAESLLALSLRDFNIGRSADNDLIISDDGVSRHHARLRFVDGTCEVVDLHSKNGVYLNGERVRQETLRHRDCLQIGATRIFLLCDAMTTDAGGEENSGRASEVAVPAETATPAESVARMTSAWQRLLLQCAIKVAHAQQAVLARRNDTGEIQIVACCDATSGGNLLASPTAAAHLKQPQEIVTFAHGNHHQFPALLSSEEQEFAQECLNSGRMCSMRVGRHRLIQVIDTPTPALLRCSAVTLPLQREACDGARAAAMAEGTPHFILLRWPRREQPLSPRRLVALQRFGVAAATCWSKAGNCLAEWQDEAAGPERQASNKPDASTLGVAPATGAQASRDVVIQHQHFAHVACWSNPAGSVSGDYCEVIPIDENEVMIVQADISGKSELMAVLLCLLQVGLHLLLPVLGSPLKITEALNRLLLAAMPNSIFVTLFLAVLDRRHNVLRYVNAGHPPALAIVPTAGQPELHLLRTSGPALGVIESPELREEALPWPAGATLLAHTDGIIEARRDNGAQFGLEGLTQAVLSAFRSPHPPSPSSLLEAIRAALANPAIDLPAVDSRRDDQTLLALTAL